MASNLLRGLVLGFAIAALPGPIFFLCLRRTLTRGWSSGIAAGLGVATGDGIYAALAAFGVAAVTGALVAQRRGLALLGGGALLVLGLRSLLAAPAKSEPDPVPANTGLGAGYLSTLGLTLTNPATIVAFAGVFAGFGLGRTGGPGAILLVAGVLLGSTLWWVVLASLVASLRRRITPAVVRGIGLLSGLAILAFGLLAIASAVSGYR
ncbi:MAG: LysE family translocator [Chloroflexi bacterium]|nr:MAG: LysE family translocator [Chloroflexota bacterium]